MAPWMNKKEINGITNPVLRSTVIAGVHAKQRSSITVSACFSKLSSLESTPFVEIVRLNRNAVSDAYSDDSIHPQVEHSAYYSLFVLCDFAMRAKRKERRWTKRGRRRIRREDRVDPSLSSFLLVPSIEADKGKRRLAFSSMHSLSLFFLFHSLFSPSHLTLAAALQLSATHAPPSLPPSRTTTQPLVPASS